jgi:transcriptional regulator GlxA family with amidase domain
MGSSLITRELVVGRHHARHAACERRSFMECGILVFDDVDLMDVAGPYEVLLTASRLQERAGVPGAFDVVTIGAHAGPVTAFGGLQLTAQRTAQSVTRLDVLVVPGAVAIDEVSSDPALLAVVKRLASVTRVTASVCTGAFILHRAGVLSTQRATTHWEDVPALAALLGPERVHDDVRWVDEGVMVTGGGLSSGIAMTLHLVERFAGRELAEATARQIDYVWTQSRT